MNRRGVGYNNSSTNIQEVLLDFRTLLEGEGGGGEGQTNLKLAPRRGTLQIERNNYEIKPFNQTISIGIFYNCFLLWNKETLKILQCDFFTEIVYCTQTFFGRARLITL